MRVNVCLREVERHTTAPTLLAGFNMLGCVVYMLVYNLSWVQADSANTA
jgi:hypothetical protein